MAFKRTTVSIFCVGTCMLNCFYTLNGATYAQVAPLDSETIRYVPPTIDNRGRPDGRRGGAASRSSCFLSKDHEIGLTALVPAVTVTLENTATETTVSLPIDPDLTSYEAIFSLTTKAHPTFWFYIPDVSDKGLTLEFVFQNEQGQTLYQSKFEDYREQNGIVEVTLPETVPGLTVGGSYQWYFITHCNETETADSSPYVKGWISRTELDLAIQNQLSNASNLEQASIYSENSVWHDTLATLRELGLQEPENAAALNAWINLLQSVGLDEIADKPIIDCCTFVN